VGLCLGPYGGPREGGLCFMSEVPLHMHFKCRPPNRRLFLMSEGG